MKIDRLIYNHYFMDGEDFSVIKAVKEGITDKYTPVVFCRKGRYGNILLFNIKGINNGAIYNSYYKSRAKYENDCSKSYILRDIQYLLNRFNYLRDMNPTFYFGQFEDHISIIHPEKDDDPKRDYIIYDMNIVLENNGKLYMNINEDSTNGIKRDIVTSDIMDKVDSQLTMLELLLREDINNLGKPV